MTISLICPVYRTEFFLKKCIDSVISQTYKDWELILIDDGSPDNAGSICDEYAKRDSRIKVIHKKNEGVSAARQAGLDTASGKYIIHVDSDDWIEPTMLEELYLKAIEEDADMVICDYYRDDEMQSTYIEQKPYSLQSPMVLKELFSHLHGNCWNKLVKKDCFTRYNIKFPPNINYCEDVCVNVQLLLHEIKIVYLPKAYYHYVQQSSSITNNFTKQTLETCIRYVEYLSNYFEAESFEIIHSKEIVKQNAVNSGILDNNEMLNLFPEIKKTTSKKIYDKVGYFLAFRGYQNSARLVFKTVKKLIKLRNLLKI